jgi:autotransporter-associated beta strand protein
MIAMRSLTTLATALFALLVAVSPVAAVVWDTTNGDGQVVGGDGSWDLSSSNWTSDDGLTNSLWTNPADAQFTVGSGTVSVAGLIQTNSITFDSAGYTLADAGGSIELTGLASLVVNANATIDAQIIGSAGLNKSGAGTLVLGNGFNAFTGNVAVSGGALQFADDGVLGDAGNPQTISLSNGAELAYTGNSFTLAATRALNVATGQSGVLNTGANNVTLGAAGQLAGAGTLTKTGAGHLILANANSGFTGTVNVSAGRLQLNADSAAGTSKIVLNGGNLWLQSDAALNAGNAVEVVSNATVTMARHTTGAALTHVLGPLSIGNAQLTFAGSNANSGEGGIRFGAVTLTGDPTFVATGPGGVTSMHTLGSIDDGGVARTITKAGPSRLILGGPSTFTAGTKVVLGNGVLRLTDANALNGAILDFNPTEALQNYRLELRANAATTYNAASILLNANSEINVDRASGSGTNVTLTLNAPIAVTGARTLAVVGGNDYILAAGPAHLEGDLTLNVGGNLALGTITEDATPRSLVKTGNGTLSLMTANSYSGTTTLSAGTLRIGNDGALSPAAVTVTAAAAIASTDATVRTLANNFTLNATMTVGQTAGGGTGALTLTGNLEGIGGLNKVGGGTLQLGGNNSYSGATAVTGGALRIDAPSDIAGTSGLSASGGGRVELSGGVVINKPITISGDGGGYIGPLQSQSGNNEWAGDVTLGSNGVRLGANTGTSLTVSGVVSSGANVYDLGIRGESVAEVITLSGANTYLGDTLLIVGTLRIVGDDRLPIASGLVVGNSSNVNSAVFDLNGYNQTVSRLASAGSTMARQVTSAAPATLTVDGTASSTYGGTIGGAVSLVKNNTGELTLSGNSSYSGSTTISNGGVVVVSSSANLGNDSAGNGLILAGGKLRTTAGVTSNRGVTLNAGANAFDITTGTTTFGGPVTGAGGFTKLGSGELIFSHAGNDFAGDVLVQGGTLSLASMGSNIASTITLDGGHFNATGSFTTAHALVFAGTTSVLSAGGGDVEFTGLITGSGGQIISVGGGGLMTLSGGIAGGMTIDKQGIGTLRLSGDLSGLGGYTITAGTLQVNSAPPGTGRTLAIPLGTGFGAGFAATQENLIDRITLDSAGVVALGVDSTFDPDFTDFTAGLRLGASDVATLTGTITSADGTVRLGGGGSMLTLATLNAVSGSNNLDLGTNGTAAGTVFLAADNDFSGSVAIRDGMTLRLANLSSMGTGTGPINVDNGVLQLANGGAFAALTGRTLAIGAGGATLDTGGNNLVQPILEGSGNFTKAGAGTLTLNQDNVNLHGALAVAGGTLRIEQIGAFGTSTAPISVGQGASLDLAPTGGAMTIANAFSISGGGMLRNVSGNNTINGLVTAASGASILSNSGLLTLDVASGNAINGAGSLIIGGSGDIRIADPTASTINSMTKIGAGTVTFAGDPNQTGSFFIDEGVVVLNHNGSTDANFFVNSGGTLRLVGDNRLGDNYDVTVNGTGTFDMRGNDTIRALLGNGLITVGAGADNRTLSFGAGNTTFTFDGTTVDTPGVGKVNLTKVGTGTATLTGANAGTGTVQVSAGTLVVSGPNGRLSGGGVAIVGDNNGNDEALILGNTADEILGVLDRVADTGTLRFNGSVPITYYGAAAGGATVEKAHALHYNAGMGAFSLEPAAGGEVQVDFNALVRSNDATGVIRGVGLGLVAGTPDSSRVTFAAAPTTVGGIIPFLLGGNSLSAPPDTFLGYDATHGVTPITSFAPTLAGGAGQFVSTGGETLGASVAINGLRITGGTTTVAPDTTLAVVSGAILFTGNATLAGPGSVSVGGQQAVIHTSADAPIVATVSANLIGAGGLVIAGAGNVNHTTVLSGDNSGLFGNVYVGNGTLRLDSATALNSFAGPVVTGGAGSTVELNGHDVVVRDLQGSSGGLRFINGSATTDATLTAFLTANRTYNGVLADGAAGKLSLAIGGGRTLTIEQTNTMTGSVVVDGADTVLLLQNGGRLALGSAYTVYGGTIRLHNTGSNNGDRISNTAPITLHGATFDFSNNIDSGQSFGETIGAVHLATGSNTIWVDRSHSTRTARLTAQSLTRDAGAVVVFRSQSNGVEVYDLGQTAQSRFELTAAPLLDHGIIGSWAVAQTAPHVREFAKYVASGTVSVRALEAADYASDLTAGAAANVRLTGNAALGGNASVNSLTINQSADTSIDLGGNLLRIESGGLIVNNADLWAATILNGTLTAGSGADAAGELVVHVVDSTAKPALLRAVIADNGAGAVSLTKAGGGVLDLQTTTNTYTGSTYISGGTLRIDADANLGGSAGQVVLSNNAVLEAASNITLGRTVLLTGSGGTLSAGSGAALVFNGDVSSIGSANLTLRGNVTTGGVTVGGSLVGALSNASINGASSLVGGSLRAGYDVAGVSSLSFDGGGSLSVGSLNPVANYLDVGVRTAAMSSAVQGVLDLGSLDDFTAQVDAVRLAVVTTTEGNHVGVSANVTLAHNNDIQAISGIVMSDSLTEATYQTGLGPVNLAFGSGTNTVVTPLWKVGGRKGSNQAVVTIGAGGVLDLGGFAPASSDLLVAYNNIGNTGINSLGSFDTTGGTLTADLDEIVVGYKDGVGADSYNTGGATGTLTLDATANVVTANSMRIGEKSGNSAGAVFGTVDLGGGSVSVGGDVLVGYRTATTANGDNSGVLNVSDGALNVGGDLWLGQRTGAGVAGVVRGSLNLGGGTTTIGGNLLKADSNRSVAMIAIDGGTLNLTGGTIAASQLAFRSGTAQNVASTTLDGYDVSGATPVNLANALILGDVTLPGNVALTNPTANMGGVRYESGGGVGGQIGGDLDMGSVDRTFTIEDSPIAARDLTVYGVVSGSGSLTKDGAGTLGLAATSTYTGDTNVLAGVLHTRTVTSGGTGAGNTTVGDGATLIADVIVQNSLVISAGATVELTPSALHGETWPTATLEPVAQTSVTGEFYTGNGGAAATLGAASAVPEPATWVMLLMAAAAGLLVLRKRK